MDADEREIYYYLKGRGQAFISAREISRRAGGKKKSQENPDWALPVVLRMVERGILEADAGGHYRIKPLEKRDTDGKQWVSPQIARILKQSGKDFSHVFKVDESEDTAYYDQL